jgi:DNA-binding LacI/PurR family transcriptional regulator
VRQTVADMGRTAAQALLLLLAGQPIALPTFEAKLVIRESAAMLRI